jgi:hypothetical protein
LKQAYFSSFKSTMTAEASHAHRKQQSSRQGSAVSKTTAKASSSAVTVLTGKATKDTQAVFTTLRQWRNDALQQHMYPTALFWARKLFAMTG